jgi:hypothetical protein
MENIGLASKDFVTRRECNVMHQNLAADLGVIKVAVKSVDKIDLALFGQDGTNGLVSDVREIKNTIDQIQKDRIGETKDRIQDTKDKIKKGAQNRLFYLGLFSGLIITATGAILEYVLTHL